MPAPVCPMCGENHELGQCPRWRVPWGARFTGGRPMQRIGHAFIDAVSGECVDYYVDGLGRRWMATGRWAMFRISIDKLEVT